CRCQRAFHQESAPPGHVPDLDTPVPRGGVVCTTHFPPRVMENGETVDVVAAGKKLILTVKALPALRTLLSGRPVLLERAAAVVGAEVMELAEILVKEELCAVLTPELSSGYTGLVTSAVS